MRTEGCHCSERRSSSRLLGESENVLSGHTRDCSLRSVSPLLESSLLNRILLPTDSADTVLAQTFAKRYEQLRIENESLRQTIIRQDEQIEKLKKMVKSIQRGGSDGYSSESRYDKSSSSNSQHIPTLRVTPQKRSSTSSSTQTPRSGRRPNRRLYVESSESDTTPRVRQVLSSQEQTPVTTPVRVTELTRPQTERSQRNPPTFPRSLDTLENEMERVFGDLLLDERRRTRPIVASRTISSHDLSQSAPTTPQAHAFLVELNRAENQNPIPNLAFYLKRARPDFVRKSEKRVEAVRQAAAYRAKIEAMRNEVARKVSNGEPMSKNQQDILLTDPTRIKAFKQEEMRALTRRRITGTQEYIQKQERMSFEHNRRASRVLAEVHSERTRQRAKSLTRRPQSVYL